MSQGFIVKSTSNTRAFAYIDANFPAGSTCTCTNEDGKVLKAKDTAGHWVFTIPKAGVWTVTATNGAKSKSKDVNITTEGQSVSVTLSYDLVLFANGTIAAEAGSLSNAAHCSISSGQIRVGADAYANGVGCFTNLLDLSGYSTLEVSIGSSKYEGGRVGISSDKNMPTLSAEASKRNFIAYATTPANSVKTVDISNLTSGYLKFDNQMWNTEYYIKKIVLK